MDCRKSWVVLVGLVMGGGCVTTTPKAPPTVDPPAVVAPRGKNAARQPLKPDTCVAFGQCFEHVATATKSDQTREQKIRDNARQAYQQALQLDPSKLEAWGGLARVYTQQGDYERALDTYAKALNRFPKEAPLWHDLAMCHACRKDWPQAISHFQKALELDPENRQYHQHLGFCQARAGRLDDSVATLSRVMGAALAHYQVARMMGHLKQEEPCRRHLQLALQTNPDLQEARQMLTQLDNPTPNMQQAGNVVIPEGKEARQ